MFTAYGSTRASGFTLALAAAVLFGCGPTPGVGASGSASTASSGTSGGASSPSASTSSAGSSAGSSSGSTSATGGSGSSGAGSSGASTAGASSGGAGAPATPTGFQVIDRGTTLHLSWDDVPGAGFKLYRKYQSGGYIDPSWILVNTLAAGTTSWDDTGLTPGATYHYELTAFDAAGESAPTPEIMAAIPDATGSTSGGSSGAATSGSGGSSGTTTGSGGAAGFTNEPAGLTPISDEDWSSLPPADFSSADAQGWKRSDPNNHLSVIQDPTAPMGSNVLDAHFPQYFTSGSGPGEVTREDLGVGEVFVATNIWVSPGSSIERANVWKLWYVFQAIWQPTYNRQATILALRSTRSDLGPPFYVALSEESAGGGAWLNPNQGGTFSPITAGAWHRIEVYMKRSSSDGAPDGIFRMWVDGQLYSDHTDAQLNDDLFTEWHVDPVWGGVDWHDISAISGDNPAVISLTSGFNSDPSGLFWRVTGDSNSAFNGIWKVTRLGSTSVSIPVQSSAGGSGGQLQDVTQVAQDLRFDRMYISGR